MRVRFLPLNIDGAGCYRAVFPAVALSVLGHDAGIPRFVVEDGEGRRVPPLPLPGLQSVRPGDFRVGFVDEGSVPDVVVVHMGTQRWMADWAARARAGGARVVVDLDDDLFRVPSYNPGRQTAAERKLCRRLIESADAVTVATAELGRFYGRWNANVHVLANGLHWPMWESQPPVTDVRGWSRFRVGYLGNMDYHRADLELIAAPLRKWLVAHPDVEFVAAGDPRIHDVVGTPDGQRVCTSKVWFRCLDLPSIVATMDVGLAPLVRNWFNEGKSCLKGMEYNACGVPVLASPTEEYRRWVADGENGFLCRFPRDFVTALDTLYGDEGLRRTMGVRGREMACGASLGVRAGEWEDVYAGVCGDSVAAGTRTAA